MKNFFKRWPSDITFLGIEDFVDKGEKSVFFSISLPEGTYSKVAELTVTSSLCGTCNGNYFRPITKVSMLHDLYEMLL